MSDCRFCHAPLTRCVVDLELQPLANSYVPAEKAGMAEPKFPLQAHICESCMLVQVNHDVPAEAIFTDYAYFSSYATSWVEHARRYATTMQQRFNLGPQSLVVEVASNDGYLLQHFRAAGIDVLGVEPASNVAAVAEQKGVPSEVAFFNRDTARRLHAAGRAADLMAANNVMAHVPDLNEFIAGFAILLKPQGVLTVEFPHLLNLLEQVQFDTIYHEHYSYLSLLAAEKIFAAHALRVFDVEELPTHGGSLRLFVCHRDATPADEPGLMAVRAKEQAAGLYDFAAYDNFGPKVKAVRDQFLAFLAEARRDGKKVCAYGAAAKGNTLLNYCGVTAKDVAVAYDKNPHKQSHLLPGSQIPILSPEAIVTDRPDYLLILPWNLRKEIAAEQAVIHDWGGKFVTVIPHLQVF